MTTRERVDLKGVFHYVRKRPHPKFGKYSLKFYPKDAETRKTVQSLGLKNAMHEDDDGFYFNFYSPDPFVVVYKGDAFEDFVGNGSKGVLSLIVESFQSKNYGKITRALVDGLTIIDLVKFDPDEAPAQTAPAAPTTEASATGSATAAKTEVPW